jgi:hypothetical protein
MTIDGLSKKDVGFILEHPVVGDEKKMNYFEENPLDSDEEQGKIISIFQTYLLEAENVFENRHETDVSSALIKLQGIYGQAISAFNSLDNLSFSKSVRQMTLNVFLINSPGINTSGLTRNKLKARIKLDYLDSISTFCNILRRKELLEKRNWKKHSRGDQGLREHWLNSWLDKLVAEHSNDTNIENLLEHAALFADERVNVIEHNGKKIIFLNWDREFIKNGEQTTIHPAVELLISNSDVESVMLEYFAPELKANFRGENLPENLKNHPLIQKILSILQKYSMRNVNGVDGLRTQAYKRRLFGFDAVTQKCIEQKKDVLVGDIADSYQYMIARDIVGEVVKILSTLGISIGVPYAIFFGDKSITYKDLALPLSSLGLLMTLMFYRGGVIKQGIQALEPNSLDKLTLHLEDARRLFLARAVDKATLDSNVKKDEQSSILVIYPPHHNNRIIDYLAQPNISKQMFYKTVYPFLNYNLRHYSHDQGTKNETSKKYSGWSLIKKIWLG